MSAIGAVLYRESRIRATNITFIFWDLCYPLLYMLVFGVGINYGLVGEASLGGGGYNSFFLAGALGMASFGIASNTSWSFFMDRDNGIFFEMLTYPLGRAQYLFGKVTFNLFVSIVQAAVAVGLGSVLLHVKLRWATLPLLGLGVVCGAAGWFFFYAIFALRIRRNDIFNSVTSVFYFVFLFASSMFTRWLRFRSGSAGWRSRIRSRGKWIFCGTRRSEWASLAKFGLKPRRSLFFPPYRSHMRRDACSGRSSWRRELKTFPDSALRELDESF